MAETPGQTVAQVPYYPKRSTPTAKQLSRGELYELAWSEPISKLAPRFGVSDVGLSKACRRANVPLPDRGYWQKLRVGKRPSKVPLPPRPPGVADEVVVGRIGYWRDRLTDEEILEPIPPPRSFPEPIADVQARAVVMVGKVRIPKITVVSHKVIAAVLREDEKRREKQRNSSYPSSWDDPFYDSPLERRRLSILNALFLALQRCACKPSSLSRPSPVKGDVQEFSVLIGDQHVSFTLDPIEEKRGAKESAIAKSSAPERLQLEIRTFPSSPLPRHHWQDEGETQLEDQLGEIAIALLVCAEIHYREGVLRRHEWRIKRRAELEEKARQLKAEQERRERERQAALQRQRVERLLDEATALQEAKAIRRYVEEVRAELSQSSPSVSHDELESWATWALAQADSIDPVQNRAFLRPVQDD